MQDASTNLILLHNFRSALLRCMLLHFEKLFVRPPPFPTTATGTHPGKSCTQAGKGQDRRGVRCA